MILLWVVWATVEGQRVRSGADELALVEDELGEAVLEQDWQRVQDDAHELAAVARRVDGAASSPPLVAASVLPFIGDDVSAVRTVARSARTVAEDGLVPLVDAALAGEGLDRFVVNGRVDHRELARLEEPAAAAAAAASDATAAVSALDTDDLLASVHEPVTAAAADIEAAGGAVETVRTATRLLPGMLGADGPRSYLLVFQNLAEARPTGGIFGAWASITAVDGRLALVETGVNDDLGRLGLDLGAVDPAVLEVYGPDVALSQNMNLSADFPTAAKLVSDLWVARGRPAPDGVVSLDPVVLAAVLRQTGQVDIPGGPTLNGRNAVRVLQNDVYRILGGDVAAREAYLARAVSGVFRRFVDQASTATFLGVVPPVARGHLQVWSSRAEEQQELARNSLGSALPEPSEDTVGVFTTNSDASKLDHFVTRSVRIQAGCGRDPVLVLAVGNDAPAQVPYYVAAKGPGAVVSDPATTHRLVASLYLSPQRGISSLSVDGVETAFSVDTEAGWTLVRVPMEVPAGATGQLRVALSGLRSAPDTVLLPPAVRDPPPQISSCPG